MCICYLNMDVIFRPFRLCKVLNLILIDEGCKLLSYSACSCLQPSVSDSVLGVHLILTEKICTGEKQQFKI